MRKWLFVFLALAACENVTAPGGSAGMTAAGITVRGPAQTVYTIGEAFSGEELFVTAHYDNGRHGTLTNYALSWNGAPLAAGNTAITAEAGTKTVTVTYQGKSAAFTIMVNAPGSPTLTEITLTGPDKTVYTTDEPFDPAGLVVTAHYSDDTTAPVTNYTLSWNGAPLTDGAITAEAGEKTVTVTYQDKSAAFTIMVNAPGSILTEITISGPDKTIYTMGEGFDSAGLVVTAHYSDGTDETTAVVTNYTLTWNGAPLTDGAITAEAGEKTVTVTYQDKSAAFTITVNAPGSPTLTEITLSGPDKTAYTTGEAFSSAGLVVTAHYSDGTDETTAPVTNYTLSWNGASLTDGAITAEAGEKTVTVTYQDKSATFMITVNAPGSPTLTEITLTGPTQTVYTTDEVFDSTGLAVTAHYSDGSTAPVTNYTLTWNGASFTDDAITAEAGSKTVTVTYQGESATFTITVTIPITFNADGGSPATQTKTVPSGGSVGIGNMPPNPTRAGFTFGGWYTSTEGRDTEFTASTTVTAALTVYAKWEISSAEGLTAFLSTALGPLDNPIPVKMAVNPVDYEWTAIVDALAGAGKYVTLDLSDCTMSGAEFDPGANYTGEKFITGLVLPDAAESIKGGFYASPAFRYFTELKILSAAGVETVGGKAFRNCTALTTVSLPAATSIGDDAFSGCTVLTTVSLPAATSIGDSAFAQCWALTEVSLPAATSIGYDAFSGCTALTTVSLPAATSIGLEAFYDCAVLTTVSLPAAMFIGGSAFYQCTSLTEVSLPAATSIGGEAFRNCTALTTMSLPAAPPTLGSVIFYSTSGGSNVITITVPSEAAVENYKSAWGVDAVTAAAGNANVYGDDHAAVTIAAAP